ncbi:MAG: hypothetical protein IJ784_13190 [Ruminiclostridium sp.]|nr:hypothetical protein [Ruminiclostridium sp.]
MIFDISDEVFRKIINDEKLFLPLRWNGDDFISTLKGLFDYYIDKIIEQAQTNPNHNGFNVLIESIEIISGLIIKSLQHYLNGFPHQAFCEFEMAMEILIDTPLKIYQKSVTEQFENPKNDDDLNLYRVVRVNDNKPYTRSRVFHTPYNLRSKVSTSRYSIAGYPSLYLSTSLKLCCEELHLNPLVDYALTSLFRFERTIEYSNVNISVIELGIKPQDFLNRDFLNESSERYRYINHRMINSKDFRSAYLLWYPLIAACSFIRVNKNDPFAAEYIIPQLLMQWIRTKIKINDELDQLMGIRYFSCASIRASEMGFNYVFPTSGKQKTNSQYCDVLSKAFKLTKPIYIHEYDSINECEIHLNRFSDFRFIESDT